MRKTLDLTIIMTAQESIRELGELVLRALWHALSVLPVESTEGTKTHLLTRLRDTWPVTSE